MVKLSMENSATTGWQMQWAVGGPEINDFVHEYILVSGSKYLCTLAGLHWKLPNSYDRIRSLIMHH